MKKKQPLVSIFMPTYNHARFLDNSIKSILDQKYKNIVIVIGDDCSTDNSKNIILKYKNLHPNKIKFYENKKNIGVSKHFKDLYNKCEGDYIAHFSGDDIFYPDKIEKQVAFMELNKDCVLCGHDTDIIDKNGNLMNYKFSDLNPITRGRGLKNIIENGTCFPGPSWLVRKNKDKKIEFDEKIKYRNDWKLLIDIVGNDSRYDFIEGIFSAYRIHDKNLSSKFSFDKYFDIIKIIKHTLLISNKIIIIYWIKFFLNSLLRKMK